MTEESWPEVTRIYEAGTAARNATSRTEAPDWEACDKSHRNDCRLLAIVNDKIVGWVAVSPVSIRAIIQELPK